MSVGYIFDGLISSGKDYIFCFEADGNVWSLEILILHHQLEGGSEKTPLQFVDIVTKLIVQFGLFREISVVNAKLGLSHQNIAIAEVYQEISVVRFKSVLHPYHFELFAAFCN